MYVHEDRNNILTITLVVINIAMYIYLAFLSNNPFVISNMVLMIFGQFNYAVVRLGFYHQLISAMFVHLNLGHLLINMFWLYILGVQVERLLGEFDYLIIYFVGGLLGNILTLIIYPLYTISGGASGAIFSLFGAILMYGGTFHGRIGASLIYAFLILIMNSAFGANIIAHMGGLIVGLIYGYYKGKLSVRKL